MHHVEKCLAIGGGSGVVGLQQLHAQIAAVGFTFNRLLQNIDQIGAPLFDDRTLVQDARHLHVLSGQIEIHQVVIQFGRVDLQRLGTDHDRYGFVSSGRFVRSCRFVSRGDGCGLQRMRVQIDRGGRQVLRKNRGLAGKIQGVFVGCPQFILVDDENGLGRGSDFRVRSGGNLFAGLRLWVAQHGIPRCAQFIRTLERRPRHGALRFERRRLPGNPVLRGGIRSFGHYRCAAGHDRIGVDLRRAATQLEEHCAHSARQ